MRSFLNFSSLAGAFLLTCGVACGQQYHDGYTRLYKEMEKELNPGSLAEKELIELLDDSRFYAREVATNELVKRGTKHSGAVILCMKTGSIEARHRADDIMGRIAHELLDRQKMQFTVTVKTKVSSPRFWSGSNQHLGGQLDRSLDSDIELHANHKLSRVTSPVTVVSAKSDFGETLGGQIWAQHSCSDTSASLFLNRPRNGFSSVTAEVVITGFFEAGENIEIPMKKEKTDIRKDLCWVSISKYIDKESKQEFDVVTITDLLGRLRKSELPELLGSDNSPIVSKYSTNDCSYQRYWMFPVDQDTAKTKKVRIKIGGPLLPFEQKHKVTVGNPHGANG